MTAEIRVCAIMHLGLMNVKVLKRRVKLMLSNSSFQFPKKLGFPSLSHFSLLRVIRNFKISELHLHLTKRLFLDYRRLMLKTLQFIIMNSPIPLANFSVFT